MTRRTPSARFKATTSLVALLLGLLLATCGGGGGGGEPAGTPPPSSATLVSISVTPSNPRILPGTTKQFTATGTYSDGTSRDITALVTWNSSNPAVATVSGSPATAVAAGTASITATYESITGSTTLTVTLASLSSISVTPANRSIHPGTTQQFTATGTYSDGTSQDITALAAWDSSNPAVATVSGSLAVGIAAGSTSITATCEDVTGSTTLAVPQLLSITIIPGPTLGFSISAARVYTTNLFATGAYSDGTSQDITTQVTWDSSNPAVAYITGIVDSQGSVYEGLDHLLAASLFWTRTKGSGTVTATLEDVTGSVDFTAF